MPPIPLLFRLEVVEEDGSLLRLLTPVLDDDAGAVDDLTSVSFAVEDAWTRPVSSNPATNKPTPCRKLTKAGPLAKLLAIRHLDQGDFMLRAQRDDELLICFLLARLVQHAHVRLPSVQRLGRLPEPAREAVVHERKLENTLQRVQDGHLALGGRIGRNLDLLGNLGSGGLFYVRLKGKSVSMSVIFSFGRGLVLQASFVSSLPGACPRFAHREGCDEMEG